MKSLRLTVLFVFAHFYYASAQLKLGITSSFRSDFQKIMAEYPEHFESIRGEVINQNPQTVEYASQLKLTDAEECIITKYSSGGKPVYSWQALIFTSENYLETYR